MNLKPLCWMIIRRVTNEICTSVTLINEKMWAWSFAIIAIGWVRKEKRGGEGRLKRRETKFESLEARAVLFFSSRRFLSYHSFCPNLGKPPLPQLYFPYSLICAAQLFRQIHFSRKAAKLSPYFATAAVLGTHEKKEKRSYFFRLQEDENFSYSLKKKIKLLFHTFLPSLHKLRQIFCFIKNNLLFLTPNANCSSPIKLFLKNI